MILNKKILMIITFRDFKDQEYFMPREIFENSGLTVCSASTQKGKAIGSGGKETQVDLTLEEVKADDYGAVVFVGGPGAHGLIENSQCHRIAKEALANNKILGAICIAPAILAKAGVLTGKKATVWSSASDKSAIGILKENGANFKSEAVVRDGKIITANGPSAAGRFAEMIVEALTENNKDNII